jgi:transitional endoplasmic reticulum ATPase
MTEGCVGADIEFICKRASMLAIRDFIQIKGEKDFTKIKIYPSHFLTAMEQNNTRRRSVEPIRVPSELL